MAKRPAELCSERLKRIEDAVEARKPDKVPILMEFGYLVARYSGITYQDIVYDSLKCAKAYDKIVTELEPDVFHFLPFDSRSAMETIDTNTVKWPGRGLGPNIGHQYVEGECMLADEYDYFLEDPTGFMLRTYLPRTCQTLRVCKEYLINKEVKKCQSLKKDLLNRRLSLNERLPKHSTSEVARVCP